MDNNILPLSEIKALMKRSEYTKAMQAIETYLQHNHSDSRAIDLHRQISATIYKVNLKKVKESIHKIEFMWKQKRYKELLELYLKIQEFAPNYAPLQHLIQKAYQAHLKEESKLNDSKITMVNTMVQGYLDTNNYNQALEFLIETIKTDNTNPTYQKLLVETKRKIIDRKLKENKESLKHSTKIPEVYDFVKKLYELEPTYFKIQKELNHIHKKLKKYYEIREKNYTIDAQRQIKVLFNQGNYEKSLQACKDLLRAKQSDKFARKYYKKNIAEIDNKNFKSAYEKLNAYLKTI